MSRLLLFCAVLFLTAFVGINNNEREFFIGDGKYVKSLRFKFESPAGYSKISSVDNPDLARCYGKFDDKKLKVNFSKYNSRGAKSAQLEIVDIVSNEDVKDALNSYKHVQNEWEIYLSKQKLLHLDFKYGSGNSNINLSDLAVQTLRIENINASVVMDYEAQQHNTILMDTFLLKVNKGYFKCNRATYAKMKYAELRVKYGTASLDFSADPIIATNIKAKVGNGNLRIDLPPVQYPVRIKINGGNFKLKELPGDFIKLSDGDFINTAYNNNKPNALNIEIDLAYGDLLFKRPAKK